MSNLEYLFVNAISDAGIIVFRAKAFDSLERTYIRLPNGRLKELKAPGSVTTVGWDIDMEGRIAGYYDTLDGRRHGFIAIPLTSETVEDFSNVYVVSLPSEDASVALSIYDVTGQRIRMLSLGFQSAGFYQSRSRAAHWNGRNDLGEQVSSGVYFYQLSAPSEHQLKRMVIVK